MQQPIVFSVIESPIHPDFSKLYQILDFQEFKLSSMRKALVQLKKLKPDYVIAEFFYGYGNNYAGVNVCNLDVLLSSLQKYAPEAKMIVMVDKAEYRHVDKLAALFPLHAILQHPVSEEAMNDCLKSYSGRENADLG